MNRLLMWLTRSLPLRTIALDSGPYLERYFVGQWFGVTVYLHRFLSSDTERHLHNHPWTWGRSAVLSGAYDEESVLDICPHIPGGAVTTTRRVRWFNRVDGSHFHRISNAAPNTWTLFIHGPRQWVQRADGVYVRKGWGFLEDCKFVEYPSAADDGWREAPTRAEQARAEQIAADLALNDEEFGAEYNTGKPCKLRLYGDGRSVLCTVQKRAER